MTVLHQKLQRYFACCLGYLCDFCQERGRWCCSSDNNDYVKVKITLREVKEGERDPRTDLQKGDILLSPFSDTRHGGRRIYLVTGVEISHGRPWGWYSTCDGLGCSGGVIYPTSFTDHGIVESIEVVDPKQTGKPRE